MTQSTAEERAKAGEVLTTLHEFIDELRKRPGLPIDYVSLGDLNNIAQADAFFEMVVDGALQR